MKIIRVHHQSRKRILIFNLLSMIVIGPFLFGIASIWQFQGPPMWIACVLFVANMFVFGLTTWNVLRNRRDFICLLTDERIVCQSPDETSARSFDIPLCEIVRLVEKERLEGGPTYSVITRDGASTDLAYGFGNPAWAFFDDLIRLLPSVPAERC
jgi:hypothetical protein